jgi:hypothetical protein
MRIIILVSVLIIVVMIVSQLSKSLIDEKEVKETTKETKGLFGQIVAGIKSIF